MQTENAMYGAEKSNLLNKLAMQKLLRLYPSFIVSFSITAFIKVFILGSITVKDVLKHGVWEVLLLTGFGMPGAVSGYFWFIPVLLFSVIVVGAVIIMCNEKKSSLLFLFIPCVIYAELFRTYGYLDLTVGTKSFLLTAGFWRGIAGVSLGHFLYLVSDEISNRISKLSATITESVLFVICIVMMWRTRRDIKDFLMIVVFAVLILSIQSQKSVFFQLTKHRVFGYLGRISYGIYVNQAIFIYFIKEKYPPMHTSVSAYWIAAMVFLVCNILFSMLSTYCCDHLKDNLLRKRLNLLPQQNNHRLEGT